MRPVALLLWLAAGPASAVNDCVCGHRNPTNAVKWCEDHVCGQHRAEYPGLCGGGEPGGAAGPGAVDPALFFVGGVVGALQRSDAVAAQRAAQNRAVAERQAKERLAAEERERLDSALRARDEKDARAAGAAEALRIPAAGPRGPKDPAAKATPEQAAVAARQSRMLRCATKELDELAKRMGPDGAELAEGIERFRLGVEETLASPCGGKAETQTVQSLSLSKLTARGGAEQRLTGDIVVVRDDATCEVRLTERHAAAADREGPSRIFGKRAREGQSVLVIDAAGQVVDREVPEKVRRCLDRKALP